MTAVPANARGEDPAFVPGTVCWSHARTLGEADFAALIAASGEDGPLHTDPAYMANSRFGRLILGGPCLVAVTAGLATPIMYAMWRNAGLDCVTALGLDNVRYLAPVFVGDTVRLKTTVVSLTPTSRGSALVGTVDDVVVKQDDTAVMTQRKQYLLRKI